MPDINRPHIAALLRLIADGAAMTCNAMPENNAEERQIKIEVMCIVSPLNERLRQRADEIEGPLHGPL